jgi:hypothetical protein
MIMFGSFLPSLLVGFRTTNFTRASEPTLSWNQLFCRNPPHYLPKNEGFATSMSALLNMNLFLIDGVKEKQ